MSNDITILSCPICNNPKLREYGNGIYRCDVCETYFDKDGNIVPTEQEYIQTCNTEQLAEYLADVCYGLLDDVWGNDGDTSCNYRETEKNYWVEWLKQPHTPKE